MLSWTSMFTQDGRIFVSFFLEYLLLLTSSQYTKFKKKLGQNPLILSEQACKHLQDLQYKTINNV